MLNVNKFSHAICALLLIQTSTCFAITVGGLAQKNNEYLEVEADLAIAKKKAELAPYAAPKPSMATPKVRTSPTADVDNLEMVEFYGDVNNPVAEFIQNGMTFKRRRGETIGSWTVSSLRNKQAVLVKSTATTNDIKKKGKAKQKEVQPLTKVIYLSAKTPAPTYGQLESRTTQPIIPTPLPVPVVMPGK